MIGSGGARLRAGREGTGRTRDYARLLENTQREIVNDSAVCLVNSTIAINRQNNVPICDFLCNK